MSESQPNVLVLLSDQHNYRCLGHVDDTEGGEPVHTPALDDLAESGTVFEQTYCPVPLCAPSRISMLTGREARDAGGWRNGSVLRPELSTLPEAFADAGYETCLVGKMHLGGSRQFVGFNHRPYGDLTGDAGHQYDPLFDGIDFESINIQKGAGVDASKKIYDSRWRQSVITHAGVVDFPESLLQEANVIRETVAFLREHRSNNPDQPWFLCASLSRPHPPYTAPRRHFERYWPDDVPPPQADETDDHPLGEAVAGWMGLDALDDEDTMRARAGYFACVDYLDELIGDLLTTLDRDGFLDDTIVVYTSDHGELIGEHGLWGKRTWHEESSRVPWIVQHPDHRSGDVPSPTVSTPVSLVDLFPTLCGLTNVAAPDDLDGTDLSETIRDGTDPDRGPVFCDLLIPQWGEGTEYRMIRDGRYKYVGFREFPDLLFDVETDPFERNNLAADPDSEEATIREEFRRRLDDTMDFEAVAEERARADAQADRYALRAAPSHGNVYHMPDGRLVDAETPLYQPRVLAKDASDVFDDWPRDDG